jgi:hypothetical protein
VIPKTTWMMCCVGMIVALSSVFAQEEENPRFFQLSRPGFSMDAWWTSSGQTVLAPAYRHYLVTVLDTNRPGEITVASGRWTAYLQTGPLISLDSSEIRGGYFGIGGTVSLESSRRLRRSYLIPFLGLEGGIATWETSRELYSGAAATTLLGIHIWSTPLSSFMVSGGWSFTTLEQLPHAFRVAIALDLMIGPSLHSRDR